MEKSIFKSACPYDCFDCCGFDVEVEENRVVKITPNRETPLTGGFLCKKGTAHQERMYREDRLRYPLKRVGTEFERISWDTAIREIAERIRSTVDLSSGKGSEGVALYQGGGAAGLLKNAHEVFFAHLGGYTTFSGGLCCSAGVEGTRKDFGAVLGHHPDDILNSKFIVLWGRNPMETNVHLVPYIKKAKALGAKVLLIDPIETKSRSLADTHIKLRKDSDWALALLVIRQLFDLRNKDEACGSIDLDFIYDGSGTLEYIKNMAPSDEEFLLDATGLEKKAVEEFARDLMSEGPSTCYVGYGPQRYRDGGLNIRLMDLLWAVSGNIGIPGGGINFGNQTNRGLFKLDFAMPKKAPTIREFPIGFFADEIERAEPKVEILFISCGNPVGQLPDVKKTRMAIKGIPYKIAMEHFLTDSAKECDLVLPISYFTESEDVITSSMWNSSYKYVSECVTPLGETKSELEVFQLLAEELGLVEFPKLSPSEWLKRGMKGLAERGLTYDRLRQEGAAESPLQKNIQWAHKIFATGDGKFHAVEKDLIIARIERFAREGLVMEKGISLVSVHWSDQINSQHSVQRLPERSILYLHPKVAKDENLETGNVVSIRRIGEPNPPVVKVEIEVTEKAGESAGYIRQGAWESFGGSVNYFTPQGESDMGGQALLNEIRVEILRE